MNPSRTGPVLLAAVLALIAGSADAGVIRGSLRAPAAEPARAVPDPYAGNANAIPGAAPPAPGRITDAVIWVEALPDTVAASLSGPSERPRLVQENQAFVPRVLPVAIGSEVDFPNRDPIYHNVFSLSPVQRFDLGKYPKGQSRTVTFRRAGVAHVFCDIHSNMEAFVVVTPNRAFTQPDRTGAWALPELPPGRYGLVLWHPEFGERRSTVTLPAEGDARADLAF